MPIDRGLRGPDGLHFRAERSVDYFFSLFRLASTQRAETSTHLSIHHKQHNAGQHTRQPPDGQRQPN